MVFAFIKGKVRMNRFLDLVKKMENNRMEIGE